MNRIFRIAVTLILTAAPSAWLAAQQAEDPPAEDAAESASESESVVDDAEEVEIDETSYLDTEEEDFRPSEEIGADQSIAFPTDI